MITEQPNPNSHNIDQLPTLEMLQTINDEDQKVASAVRAVLPTIAEAVDAIYERMARGGRLIYAGAGTSGRLGVLDAAECVPTFGTPPELVVGLIAGGYDAMFNSIEGAEDRVEAGLNDVRALNLTERDVVVGIAASGTTPYVLGALNYAMRIGALTIGLACNMPAPVLDAAQIKIGVVVGPEVITGSTRMKAGTAQKLVLNMMSTAVMVRLGKVYGNLMVDVQITNEKLGRRARGIVQEVTGVDAARADYLLRAAGGSAKVAIVMHLRKTDASNARALLEAADGQLRRVIEESPE
jgi:N-acetylmuramic acid 6-phosphate etherase